MTSDDVLDALRRAVLDDPADLAARYAHADACEEAGLADRAAFARASLAGDHAAAGVLLTDALWWRWFGNPAQDAGGRGRRLRVNVQPTPDGVLVHVRDGGGRIRWGYQAVIRGGWIDEFRGPVETWLAGLREAHPVTAYRPLEPDARYATTQASRQAAGRLIRLWQDRAVGRLRALDLRALCPDAEALGYVLAFAAHAWRPWRGLGRVVLPASPPRVREFWAGELRRHLDPRTEVAFGRPLPAVTDGPPQPGAGGADPAGAGADTPPAAG